MTLGQETKKEVASRIKLTLKKEFSKKPLFVATLNPEILLRGGEQKDYRLILESADLKINDGFGLQAAAFLKKEKIGERLAGADLAEMILEEVKKRNLNLGLALRQDGLSSKREVQQYLEKRGIKNFFVFSQSRDVFLESDNFPEKFKQSQVLLVGLGEPWQERFIFQAIKKDYFPCLKLAVGVGGTFDFWTGRQRRAPRFLRKIGLEWWWRLIFQPKRFFRIWRATVVFLWRISRE